MDFRTKRGLPLTEPAQALVTRPDMSLDTAIDALKMLTHPARMEIFRLLLANEPESMTMADLEQRIASRHTRLTIHLSLMTEAGLVCSSIARSQRRFRACAHVLPDLVNFMSSGCCGRNPERCIAVVADRDDLCFPS